MSIESAAQHAYALMEELGRSTASPPGVSRDSFGQGEQLAHSLLQQQAALLGLEQHTDPIGNLYVTLPGADRNAPAIMIGSHLDSVHHGGNFDGAAGVMAGFAILEHLHQRRVEPPFDITVMAIRAEEMVWFPIHYLGSRAAFGLLPPDTPDTVCRSDTERSLGSHMTDLGFDPNFIRAGKSSLTPAQIRCYLECHIEQGPVLVNQAAPVGIVNAIRGNIRYRFANITGQTTHAGGVPRSARRDAVLAGAELLSCLEAQWKRLENEGADLVLTVGQFATNPKRHGITKVPGELAFTLDFRSIDNGTLSEFDRFVRATAERISIERNVSIDLGSHTRATPATMDSQLRTRLFNTVNELKIPYLDIASGGGHDCAVFADQGVPCAMIFVRNENGSHNPDEAMSLDDFTTALRVLASFIDTQISLT